MKQNTEQIKSTIKNYIITNFLQAKQIQNIEDDTALVSSKLLDSISTIHLISFLEKQFHIEFQPHEVDRDNFESISVIADFVNKKL